MLVHDYDDERTVEEEELMEGGKKFSDEIEGLEKVPLHFVKREDRRRSLAFHFPSDHLQRILSTEKDQNLLKRRQQKHLNQEGNMPLEDLLAFYGYETPIPVMACSSADSSASELADELPDMTLDKEEIAKDLLSGDDETQSSADDLTPSVTSHETTDFFPRHLRSHTTYDGDKESEGEDEENDCGNPSEDLKKEIMVGFQYQAEIPPLYHRLSEYYLGYDNEDQLMWSPDILPECKVKEFLHKTAVRTGSAKGDGGLSQGAHVRDNEKALYELMKANYNCKEALERYCQSERVHKGEISTWTEEECRNFEHALLIYGKDFHLVQKNKVKTRTVAECVSFYYMWKKSERYDFFAQQTRFGKKKYNHHPDVTDYMDRLVDEAEALGGAVNSLSVCSNTSRTDPIPESQLTLLNSITANELTALTHSVATVCNSSNVNCMDAYSYTPLDSLPRASVNHVPVATEDSINLTANGESECFNLLDTGFYHSDLTSVAVCTDDSDRPTKKLKMGLAVPEAFMNDVSVNALGVDFENHTHHITSAKMAVSVADFSSLSANDGKGFMNSHTLHQHTALHSE